MEVVDPGHKYYLKTLDTEDGAYNSFVELVFVKREGDKYPSNVGHYPGTTIQEVLRACIDRLKYVNNQIYAPEDDFALAHLRAAIFELENRAARVGGYLVPDKLINIDIENQPTCDKHLHIQCGKCKKEQI